MPNRGPDYMNWGPMRYRAALVFSTVGRFRPGQFVVPGIVDFGHGTYGADGRNGLRSGSAQARPGGTAG